MERISEYFEQLLDAIQHHDWVIHADLTFRQIDTQEAYIKGTLYLYHGFMLHVAEYVEIRDGVPQRPKYRYQLQHQDNAWIARWDNAPHHRDIPTHPFHKHCQDQTISASPAMTIPDVLNALDEVVNDML